MVATLHTVIDPVDFPCPYCARRATIGRVDGAQLLLHDAPPCPRFLKVEAGRYLTDVLAARARRLN